MLWDTPSSSFAFLPHLVFKNVKSVLSTLVLHKQVVGPIWPAGRGLPTPGLNHDIDRIHFSISGSNQMCPTPVSCLIYTALCSPSAPVAALSYHGPGRFYGCLMRHRARGSNWIAHSCEPHKLKSLYMLNELLDSPSSDLFYFIFYWWQLLNFFFYCHLIEFLHVLGTLSIS